MSAGPAKRRTHPAWWTLGLIVALVAVISMAMALFYGSFRSFVSVTLTSERAGLVLDTGAKVKMRGIQVGRVDSITGGSGPVRLKLQIYPDQVKFIPANVEAQILATTVFGAKYVDLVYPENPSPKRLTTGAVLHAHNVATEVNTVFENLVDLLQQTDPAKLNAVLTALAEGVRGQGERMGEAITASNEVLAALNPRSAAIQRNWNSVKAFSDTYSAAAKDIVSILDAASTTSSTITNHSAALDTLLLNTIGFTHSGIDLLGPNKNNLIQSINSLRPTTELLMKYNPIYTCTLVGAQWYLEHGGYSMAGGNGKSAVLDVGLLLGKDPYRYPDNLPIVAAKGGPGGKPGCGSLPIADNQFPVRQLVTNTGWGTGIDIRPNPGVGVPGWIDFFPYTRAIPEPPFVRYPDLPPAPGPPNSPPYGAPLYAPDGTPLFPATPGTPIYEGIFGTPLWPDTPPAINTPPGPPPSEPMPASPPSP